MLRQVKIFVSKGVNFNWRVYFRGYINNLILQQRVGHNNLREAPLQTIR